MSFHACTKCILVDEISSLQVHKGVFTHNYVSISVYVQILYCLNSVISYLYERIPVLWICSLKVLWSDNDMRTWNSHLWCFSNTLYSQRSSPQTPGTCAHPHTQLIKAKTVTCSQEWCTHSYMEFVACISPIQVHTHSSEYWTQTYTEQWAL